MFAHGFNIRFNTIAPPADVDVSLIAPNAADVMQAKIDNARYEKRGNPGFDEQPPQERAQQIGLPAFVGESAARGLAPDALMDNFSKEGLKIFVEKREVFEK